MSLIVISTKGPLIPLICTRIVSVPSVIPSSTAENVFKAVPKNPIVKLPDEVSAISDELIPNIEKGTLVPSATLVVVTRTSTFSPSFIEDLLLEIAYVTGAGGDGTGVFDGVTDGVATGVRGGDEVDIVTVGVTEVVGVIDGVTLGLTDGVIDGVTDGVVDGDGGGEGGGD